MKPLFATGFVLVKSADNIACRFEVILEHSKLQVLHHILVTYGTIHGGRTPFSIAYFKSNHIFSSSLIKFFISLLFLYLSGHCTVI